MSAVDERLTGIEQYHWERAGYFVRRGWLVGKSDEERRTLADVLAADILGPDVQLRIGVSSLPIDDWVRDVWATANGFGDDRSALARLESIVTICWSTIETATVFVVPGSHGAPVNIELAETQSVRLKLETGDTLVMNGNLLHRSESEISSITMVGKSHPSFTP